MDAAIVMMCCMKWQKKEYTELTKKQNKNPQE